ncbi:MAG: hypothetical protein H6566_02770 [Lewinellaceae bacterium]|nr:hypothetical protein [Lewinellaceae bacterium]
MKNIKILKVFFYGALLFSITACVNQQGHGMMQGNDTMYMGNWNWLLIVITLGIGLLIGLIVARKKK